MKRLILGAAIVLIGASLTPARAEGNANFNIGQRYMSDDFWDDANWDLATQDSLGVNVDFGEDGSPFHVAFGLNTSGVLDWESDDTFSNNGEPETLIGELSAGFLWVPKAGKRVQPFLGAGISRVGVTLDLNDESENDSAFGFYANGGVFWRVTKRLNMGLDVRALQGARLKFDARELGLNTIDYPNDHLKIDADHVQVGFLIGFNWGER